MAKDGGFRRDFTEEFCRNIAFMISIVQNWLNADLVVYKD